MQKTHYYTIHPSYHGCVASYDTRPRNAVGLFHSYQSHTTALVRNQTDWLEFNGTFSI